MRRFNHTTMARLTLRLCYAQQVVSVWIKASQNSTLLASWGRTRLSLFCDFIFIFFLCGGIFGLGVWLMAVWNPNVGGFSLAWLFLFSLISLVVGDIGLSARVAKSHIKNHQNELNLLREAFGRQSLALDMKILMKPAQVAVRRRL